MISIGKYNNLKVLDKNTHALILDALELGKATLPILELNDIPEVGDNLEVFLYHNSKLELLATTKYVPTIGQVAYLQVKNLTKIGAFLDWGLDKDLFVPLAEQHRPFEIDKSYLVYLYLNKINGRVTASSKINKFIKDYAGDDLKLNQEVDLIIANSTHIGYKAIINNLYWGIIYGSEVFKRLSFGQSIKGYIKNIRDDGRIDLSLQLIHKDLDKNAALIEKYLIDHEGSVAFNDKSNPDDIKREFSISKAAFKRAIGTLLKQKKILIKDNGIYLNILPQ
ncbi:GntR family transcriptional regulator [Francisella halioticida]|uniref:CvfB family protein n=1 Tax=Francisella halioticida TaxID=549298 RepID=UPI001AF68993|nr:S1-like domain-containing RNA-binding protein [Francisella halioticida]BCD90771.1 GntR family transcriptional regulator [Francisella halioticida]